MTKEEFIQLLKSLDKINPKFDGSQIDEKSHRYVAKVNYESVDGVARCYKEHTDLNKAVFENETRALEFLGDTDLNLPDVLYKDRENLLIIESFIDGQPGGDSLDFNEDFIKKITPESVANFFKAIQQHKPDIIDLPAGFHQRYFENIDFIKAHCPGDLKEEAELIADFIHNADYSKNFLRFSHGDANPGNFIFEGNDFGVIDWETAEFTFFWNDFANIYIASNNWPAWQKRFLSAMELEAEELSEFKFGVAFKLANIITKLYLLLLKGEGRFFRSQEMSESEIIAKMKKYHSKMTKLLK